jgi:hypothetical protein
MLKKYIVKGFTHKNLSEDFGYNNSHRKIKSYLDSNKIEQIDIVYDNVNYLLIDGTYIQDKCLIVYYEPILEKVLYFKFHNNESYLNILNDLLFLRDRFNYNFIGITIDGNKGTIKAIKEVFTETKIQRCILHIQRQIINCIGKYPRTEPAIELFRICNYEQLLDISFIDKFNKWKNKWKEYLETRSEYNNKRFRYKKIRQARSHINNGLEYMYHFKTNNKIQITTNKLEGYFGVLKEQIKKHRGMQINRLFNLLSIWIYNRNLKS